MLLHLTYLLLRKNYQVYFKFWSKCLLKIIPADLLDTLLCHACHAHCAKDVFPNTAHARPARTGPEKMPHFVVFLSLVTLTLTFDPQIQTWVRFLYSAPNRQVSSSYVDKLTNRRHWKHSPRCAMLCRWVIIFIFMSLVFTENSLYLLVSKREWKHRRHPCCHCCWRCELLMAGEFTQENQVRLKHEEEKEQLRLDEWKVHVVFVVECCLFVCLWWWWWLFVSWLAWCHTQLRWWTGTIIVVPCCCIIRPCGQWLDFVNLGTTSSIM